MLLLFSEENIQPKGYFELFSLAGLSSRYSTDSCQVYNLLTSQAEDEANGGRDCAINHTYVSLTFTGDAERLRQSMDHVDMPQPSAYRIHL